MNTESKIFVAGHKGLVGSAILRKLKELGFINILVKDRTELDLLDYIKVESFFKTEEPEYVILAAAKVGGIYANMTYPAEFIYENLQVQNNVIHCSYLSRVKKLLFLGSSCIYPRNCPQPIKEDYLLTGELEKTNEPYAIAKIAGIKMCESYNKQYGTNYICVMPTNVYGIDDNFHPENSHVIPALIRKIHEAKVKGSSSVTIWGTGNPCREFIFSDDLADACIFLLKNYSESSIINIGVGKDVTIKELVDEISSVVGFKGKIVFDINMPDGIPRKLLDISKLSKLGWKPKTLFAKGLNVTYQWFLVNANKLSLIG